MKKLLLASVALISATATSFAADLPRRVMAPAPAAAPFVAAVPMFTWTGFYAGLHAGYAWSESTASAGAEGGLLAGATAAGSIPSRSSFDTDGGIFGAQIGYNAQFGGVVAGIEGDLSWTDLGGSSQSTATVIAPATATTTLRSDVDWLGTIRGRVGVAFDRALVYATGGFAFGDTNYRGTIQGSGFVPPNPSFAGSNNNIQTGYAVGAGVEYAFTNNLTVKAEWLYYDLGRETVRVSGTGGGAGGGDFVDYRFDNDGNIGRLGLNVKF
jgi:outer membrane immunogenic protein